MVGMRPDLFVLPSPTIMVLDSRVSSPGPFNCESKHFFLGRVDDDNRDTSLDPESEDSFP